jgi:hypothetical protein
MAPLAPDLFADACLVLVYFTTHFCDFLPLQIGEITEMPSPEFVWNSFLLGRKASVQTSDPRIESGDDDCGCCT